MKLSGTLPSTVTITLGEMYAVLEQHYSRYCAVAPEAIIVTLDKEVVIHLGLQESRGAAFKATLLR